MLEITQALVAIGGKATRLRTGGIDILVSKSFLKVCERPLLHWNLLSLHKAGIRRLILCGNEGMQLREAEILLDHLGVTFDEVQLLQDPGLGVHGLPHQVMTREPGWLDSSFIFECGHSFMTPAHYRAIARLKIPGNVVLSAFRPNPVNVRQPVALRNGRISLCSAVGPDWFALAHPVVVDREYASDLPSLSFDIRRILAWYSSRFLLEYAWSEMPPEFDVIEEMESALAQYRIYLRQMRMLPAPITNLARHEAGTTVSVS